MAKNFIALEETSQAILRKVTKIELVTSTAVTGNPLEVSFTSIQELNVAGTWNPASGRIEF